MSVNNVNGIGVGLNANLPQRESAPELKQEEAKEAQQASTAAPNFISSDEVMSYAAQQAAVNKSAVDGARTYDVSKYVTPEQAQRIAGFVTSFEDIVAKNLEAVTAELGSGVSESVRMGIALSSADKLAS